MLDDRVALQRRGNGRQLCVNGGRSFSPYQTGKADQKAPSVWQPTLAGSRPAALDMRLGKADVEKRMGRMSKNCPIAAPDDRSDSRKETLNRPSALRHSRPKAPWSARSQGALFRSEPTRASSTRRRTGYFRSDLKPARSSSVKSFGCSQAAK